MDEIIEENVAKQTAFLEGKYEGKEEGIRETQREMVINLYNKNISLDIISECSGLTIEEVKEMVNYN